MIVVGIDLSLRMTGLAIADTELGELVFATRVAVPSTGPSLKSRRGRIRRCVDGIMKCIPEDVGLVVIEQPLPPIAGRAGMQIERAGAYWMLIDQLLPRVGGVVEVHPKTRAKLAAGHGGDGKGDVLERVRSDFPHLRVADDNVADAIVLTAAGARWAGAPLVEYSPKQEEAHATVAWPERITAS